MADLSIRPFKKKRRNFENEFRNSDLDLSNVFPHISFRFEDLYLLYSTHAHQDLRDKDSTSYI